MGTGWSVWSGAQPDGQCLPLLIFPCTIKSRSSLLAPAHPDGPGKRAVKWLWCGGGGVMQKLPIPKFFKFTDGIIFLPSNVVGVSKCREEITNGAIALPTQLVTKNANIISFRNDLVPLTKRPFTLSLGLFQLLDCI